MNVYLIYLLFFVITVTACYYALSHWLPHRSGQRLSVLRKHRGQHSDRQLHTDSTGELNDTSWLHRTGQRLGDALLRLSSWLPKPRAKSPSTNSNEASDPDMFSANPLRWRMLNAGIPSPQALPVYKVLQTLLSVLLPVGVCVYLWLVRPSLTLPSMFILMALSAMLGYYLPEAVLNRLIKRRQESLFHGFPDALDLMRMCIQAGMGLDASLDRVGREVRLSCPPLSQELALTGYELRAGASRAEALRHLSQRVGLSDVEAFVGTLIQSDRFGTSISESLQVYSDALRNKRRLQAQETAAKLPIKLLIPLVFCLFPGLLTVLLGPAVINIYTHLMPALSGQP